MYVARSTLTELAIATRLGRERAEGTSVRKRGVDDGFAVRAGNNVANR